VTLRAPASRLVCSTTLVACESEPSQVEQKVI